MPPIVYAGPFSVTGITANNALAQLTIAGAPVGYRNVITKVMLSGVNGASSGLLKPQIKISDVDKGSLDAGEHAPVTWYENSKTLAAGEHWAVTFNFADNPSHAQGIPTNPDNSLTTFSTNHVNLTQAYVVMTVFYTVQKR